MSRVLKERREDLGREISDIARITRIKGSYLKAIEEEEYEKLPVEVYTRGYIKEYAEFLAIPSDVALSPYERYLENRKEAKGKESIPGKNPPGLTKESHDNLENIKKILAAEDDAEAVTPEPEKEPRKSILTGRLLWVLPLVMIAVSIYLLVPRQQEQAPPPAQPEVARAPEAPPAPPAETPEAKAPAAEKAASEPPAKPQQTPAVKPEYLPKKHNLDIAAIDRVWIQLTIDGLETKEVMLNPGDKINYGADKAFNIRIGNAAGVVLKYDGRELKNLGRQGEVVTMVLPVPKQPQIQQQPQPAPAPGSGQGDTTAGVSEAPGSQKSESQKTEPSNQ